LRKISFNTSKIIETGRRAIGRDHITSQSSFLNVDQLEQLGFCLKDHELKVIQQNQTCKDICGDRVDQICGKDCMSAYRADDRYPFKNEGINYYHALNIRRETYDVCLIKTEQGLLTLIHPLRDIEQQEILTWKRVGLTKREIQICLLKNQGKTNQEIRDQLSIAKSTLKTHLNHIYHKLAHLEDYSLA
jgi:DNA-binding CsgD family transcriptional regulator